MGSGVAAAERGARWWPEGDPRRSHFDVFVRSGQVETAQKPFVGPENDRGHSILNSSLPSLFTGVENSPHMSVERHVFNPKWCQKITVLLKR